MLTITPHGPAVKQVKAKAGDARHLMRYLKFKSGIDAKEIAKTEGVSLKTVNDSIRDMERHVTANSDGQLQLGVRDLIISILPQAKQTMNSLLQATNLVQRKNLKTGLDEYVMVEDKTTRLEAVRVVTGMISAVQPKVPQVVTNVNQTNQTAVMSNAETNEERLRRLRAQAAAHNLLPPVTIGTPQSIDDGVDPDDDDDDDGDEE